jgi:hypothetical protein
MNEAKATRAILPLLQKYPYYKARGIYQDRYPSLMRLFPRLEEYKNSHPVLVELHKDYEKIEKLTYPVSRDRAKLTRNAIVDRERHDLALNSRTEKGVQELKDNHSWYEDGIFTYGDNAPSQAHLIKKPTWIIKSVEISVWENEGGK